MLDIASDGLSCVIWKQGTLHPLYRVALRLFALWTLPINAQYYIKLMAFP
jgi:hypothetical protein